MKTPIKLSQRMQALLPNPTPRALGYCMPAEWQKHYGTWFSWPHNLDTWSNYLASTERALAEAIHWLSQGEMVHINVLNEAHKSHVSDILLRARAAMGRVRFYCFPTNDAWCRDHGAVFLVHPAQSTVAAIDWEYNAWGEKYPPFDLDNAIPRQMCEALSVPRFELPIVLEGGSIEVNGAGVLMTTRTCLLNPNRNPGLAQEEIECVLREMLGVEEILWLAGELVGDDTDGHIDNLARFVNETTIVAPEALCSDEENYASLSANLALLNAWNSKHSNRFDIVEMPMPNSIFLEGKRMPASYMNFYIGNSVVLMPSFGDPMDEKAEAILQSCFKERKVVRMDCSSVIWGLGAIHCLTQQVPLSGGLSSGETCTINEL